MQPDDLCKIVGDSAAGVLLKKSTVLILDEVSMMSKIELRRIDRSLQYLMENNHPFGGNNQFTFSHQIHVNVRENRHFIRV